MSFIANLETEPSQAFRKENDRLPLECPIFNITDIMYDVLNDLITVEILADLIG